MDDPLSVGLVEGARDLDQDPDPLVDDLALAGLRDLPRRALGQRFGDRARVGDRRGGPHRRGRGEADVVEHLVERGAVDEVHREVVPPVDDPDIVDVDDVRVVEVGRRAGLALEPLDGLLRPLFLVEEHLDRDLALELRVLRAVDDAHPAAAQLGDDVVAAEDPPLRGRGVVREGRGGLRGRGAADRHHRRARLPARVLDDRAELLLGEELLLEEDVGQRSALGALVDRAETLVQLLGREQLRGDRLLGEHLLIDAGHGG